MFQSAKGTIFLFWLLWLYCLVDCTVRPRNIRGKIWSYHRGFVQKGKTGTCILYPGVVWLCCRHFLLFSSKFIIVVFVLASWGRWTTMYVGNSRYCWHGKFYFRFTDEVSNFSIYKLSSLRSTQVLQYSLILFNFFNKSYLF